MLEAWRKEGIGTPIIPSGIQVHLPQGFVYINQHWRGLQVFDVLEKFGGWTLGDKACEFCVCIGFCGGKIQMYALVKMFPTNVR